MLTFQSDREVVDYAEQVVLRSIKERPISFDDPEDVKRYLMLHKAELANEQFTVLFLDIKKRLIAAEDMFYGTTTKVDVEFREVARRVLAHNAEYVIVSHNHPGSESKPSDQDIRMTMKLGEFLSEMDTELIDHYVVGEGGKITSILEVVKQRAIEKLKKSLPDGLKGKLDELIEKLVI